MLEMDLSKKTTTNADPVYRIEHLTKAYKNKSKNKNKNNQPANLANADINLEIQAGEIFGLLGSNGAGKSTLIRQMVNLVAPTSGTIWLFGQNIAKQPNIVTSSVAYMPQKPQALLDLTAQEAIYFTGHLRGMNRQAAKAAAQTAVEEWGLGEVRNKAVRHLSGGQHRLIGLAITLIGEQPVLILDEPTNELDPAYRKLVWEKLIARNSEHGTTIILVTHNIQEAERVIQRVAVMSAGQVVGVGRVGELKERIDRSVRLELFIKPEVGVTVEAALQSLVGSQQVRPLHWVVLVPRHEAERAIYETLSKVGLDNLEDFRLQTASLEDVYMKLTGHTLGD
jgi:ABC-type multidrug transport system ATPase subunit